MLEVFLHIVFGVVLAWCGVLVIGLSLGELKKKWHTVAGTVIGISLLMCGGWKFFGTIIDIIKSVFGGSTT